MAASRRPAPRLIARLVLAGVVSFPAEGRGHDSDAAFNELLDREGILEQGPPKQGILEQIVVIVNGDVITKTEIDERLRITRALTEEGVASGADSGLLTRVLRDAIDERLMTQRATELGLSVRDEDVDGVLAAVEAESIMQPHCRRESLGSEQLSQDVRPPRQQNRARGSVAAPHRSSATAS
jgi:hypothetical protein